MVAIRQIITRWATPAPGDHLTVMYFLAGIDVADQREALQAFWDGLSAGLSSIIGYNIDTVGIEINDADGALQGTWLDATSRTGTGDSATQPVPDATQILVRWRSEDVVNRRFVRGRTFVPGLTQGNVIEGNIGAAAVATFKAAADDLIESAAGLVIWSRPFVPRPDHPDDPPARSGSSHTATTAEVWPELAVLRRRRG